MNQWMEDAGHETTCPCIFFLHVFETFIKAADQTGDTQKVQATFLGLKNIEESILPGKSTYTQYHTPHSRMLYFRYGTLHLSVRKCPYQSVF